MSWGNSSRLRRYRGRRTSVRKTAAGEVKGKIEVEADEEMCAGDHRVFEEGTVVVYVGEGANDVTVHHEKDEATDS